MFPVLFTYKSMAITTFAVCMILGFASVTLWAGYRTRAKGLDPNACPELLLWVLPAALAGAKLFSIIHFFSQGGVAYNNLRFWLSLLSGGGLIAYGGVIGGILAAALYMKRKGLDFLAYADAYAPALGLGVFIMRLGCFFAGCCWGKGDFGPTLSFPAHTYAGMFQVGHGFSGLFPSQLLAAFDGLLIMSLLLLIERKTRIKGGLFIGFIVLYALARTVEDYTRFYAGSEKAFLLTYNQWVSFAMVVGAVVFSIQYFNGFKSIKSKRNR